jgi:hypothetical protein
VEIGRAQVTIDDPDTRLGTHAFVMAQSKADAGGSSEASWIGVGITGHMDDANRPVDPTATKRIHVPDEFLHALAPVLAAGSTLMITDEPVLESTTGVNLAVLSSSPDDVGQAPEE